jgi:hypothetical protein
MALGEAYNSHLQKGARDMGKNILILTVVVMLFGTWSYAADCNSGRYEDMGDGTVQDCRTGLIWLKNANCLNNFNEINKSNGYLTWYEAIRWVAGLHDTGDTATGCGLSDGSIAGEWRLPTISEWRAMVASAKKQGFGYPTLTNTAGTGLWTSGDAFLNVQYVSGYWSSTTYAPNTTAALFVYMVDGSVYNVNKSNSVYVWPVRGGQSGEFGNLIIQ